mgnify:CR=1 FL=1
MKINVIETLVNVAILFTLTVLALYAFTVYLIWVDPLI